MRNNSFAIEGGAFGDEGKGKIVDELCSRLGDKHKNLVVYRYNGGANAGHTVVFENKKIVLHQIPSGVLNHKAICVLGKGMVIHPSDLATEIKSVEKISGGKIPGKIVVDETAALSLDTHRAFEGVLKKWQTGSAGSTGRGIAPAYADILLRHPVRMRDFASKNWKLIFSEHYDLYRAWVKGLGEKIESVEVSALETGKLKVGDKSQFLDRISKARRGLLPFIKDAASLIEQDWVKTEAPFIFEGAQGVGLDPRWGVYPDVSASDVAFSGILYSTQGIVNPSEISLKAATYKATYISSVGTRRLPTKMDDRLAQRIRTDANEYGATTGRPRDIYHLDIPALYFFAKVSGASHFILTHLDICYPDEPLKVCICYNLNGKEVAYKPDQEFLNKVKPVYISLPSWKGDGVRGLSSFKKLPRETRRFLKFFSWAVDLSPFMLATGPERDSIIGPL